MLLLPLWLAGGNLFQASFLILENIFQVITEEAFKTLKVSKWNYFQSFQQT